MILFLPFLLGCNNSDDPSLSSGKERLTIELDAKESEVILNANEFAFNLFKSVEYNEGTKLTREGKFNFLISPLKIISPDIIMRSCGIVR